MLLYNSHSFGAIAQLGERLRGTQEVGGSNPPSSTNHLLGDVFRFFNIIDSYV